MNKSLPILAVIAIATVMPALSQDAGMQEQATPEDLAWDQVDGMESAALDAFLKKFPNGKHAEKAQLFVSFHKRISALRNQQEQPGFVIPFSEFGERWESWESRRPERSALGIFSKKTDTGSTLGIFSPLGGPNTISFDEYGIPVVPTGDGSLVAVRTNGLRFEWVEPVAIETPGDEPLYFAVIRDSGLVYLHGAGTVYLSEGQFALPEADSQRAGRKAATSIGSSRVVVGIGIALALLCLAIWYLRSRGRNRIDSAT